jgi:uncharacterized protein YqeY
MKARDGAAISACRTALAAIGNAEAIDAVHELGPGEGPIAGARAGLRAGDAPRRELSESEVVHLVREEIADRRAAAEVYARTEEAERAKRLHAEAAVLERLVL